MKENKEYRTCLRMTKEELEFLEEKSLEEGISKSAYIRKLIRKEQNADRL